MEMSIESVDGPSQIVLENFLKITLSILSTFEKASIFKLH